MKKIPVTVLVSRKQLDLFDEYMTCVPYCSKHKMEKNEEMYRTCKDCDKVREQWWKAGWDICCQLYDKMYDDKEKRVIG